MPVLHVSNVTKKFSRKKPFYALRDVSFSVEEGEIFSILGPNGAGKTTLLNIIMGIVTPDSGSISILGKAPLKNSGIMGYVAGEERFHWSLSPHDVLNFAGLIAELPKGEKEKRIKRLIGLFELQDVLHSRFNVLSTGERMRLAFAFALMNDPKVLLLDEPTLGLDPDIAIKIRREIVRVNEELKTTIILTSHYMKEVEELADRIVFLHKGSIRDSGTILDIKKKHPNLEQYFVRMVDESK